MQTDRLRPADAKGGAEFAKPSKSHNNEDDGGGVVVVVSGGDTTAMEPRKQAAAVTASLKASASTSVLLHALRASQSAFGGGKWTGLCTGCRFAGPVGPVSVRCFAGTNLCCGGVIVGADNLRLRAAGIAGICWDWGSWVDPWQRVRVRVRRERATLESGSQHQQHMQRMRQQFEICRQSAEEGSQSEPTTAAAPRQAGGEQTCLHEQKPGCWTLEWTRRVRWIRWKLGGGFGNKKELSAVPRGNWNWKWNCRTGPQRALAAACSSAHTLSTWATGPARSLAERVSAVRMGGLAPWNPWVLVFYFPFPACRRPRLGRERRRASHFSLFAHPAPPRPLVARPSLCTPRYSYGANVNKAQWC